MEPYVQEAVIKAAELCLAGALTAEEMANKVVNLLLGASVIGGA